MCVCVWIYICIKYIHYHKLFGNLVFKDMENDMNKLNEITQKLNGTFFFFFNHQHRFTAIKALKHMLYHKQLFRNMSLHT